MRKQDTLTIAEFGNFIIEAQYNYTLDTAYHNKHAPISVEDIGVEKVELQIKRMRSKRIEGTKSFEHVYEPVKTIRLLDIPPWLWSLLNDEEVLQELDRELPERDPDEAREEQHTRIKEELREGTEESDEDLL